MAMKKVGVVVGSIRTGSYTRMVAKALSGLNPDRKSTRLNSSHGYISYAVFCLKKNNSSANPRLLGEGHSAPIRPCRRSSSADESHTCLQRCALRVSRGPEVPGNSARCYTRNHI